MAKEQRKRGPRFSLTATALTQLLAAVACFLGAYVLPNTIPEFRGNSEAILVVLGGAMLLLGLVNVLFGRQISSVLQRAGRRSRVVIPREGIGYLAIMLVLAVGALLGHRNMPLLVFGMMAGPFMFNGWVVYGMLKGIQVNRRMADRAIAGQYATVEFEVENTKRFLASQLLEIGDRIRPVRSKGNSEEREAVVTFVRIPARSIRRGRYRVRFERRGEYEIGPIRLSSRFPLGIGERGQVIPGTESVTVHPACGRLTPEWSRQLKEMAEDSNRRSMGKGLFDDEFHRIREFRSDDNPRFIHWRSTARRGQLMVREYHQTRTADSAVLLDLPKLSDWPEDDRELAVSLAATLCVEQSHSSSGAAMLLGICAADNQIVSSRSPAAFREEALDQLAICKASKTAEFSSLLELFARTQTAGCERVIVISPRPMHVDSVMKDHILKMEDDRSFSVSKVVVIDATKQSLSRFLIMDSSDSPAASSLQNQSAVPDRKSDSRRVKREHQQQEAAV